MTVISYVFAAQKLFLSYRYKYLASLPSLRAQSVLVQGIPKELQNDAKLAAFFNELIPGGGTNSVQRAYVVRDTVQLLELWTELKAAREELCKAEAVWERDKDKGLGRPQTGMWCGCLGKAVDSIDHYWNQVEELTAKVRAERDRIVAEAEPGSLEAMAPTGFVTFNTRYQKEVAIRLDRQ